MRKKKVLFHSDFALAKTGFGRAMKTLLSSLYKTEKYDIHHVCCSVNEGSPELQATPWKSYGSVPSDQSKIQEIVKDPNQARTLGYGAHTIDEHIKNIKPDIYIGTQDFWGVDFNIDKTWFKKINSCLWITLDSLPILPAAVKKAKDIKNYWVWSNFAEKELHRLGHEHVKTIHGPIDDSKFYRLNDEKRKELRVKNNLPEDAIIIGFVFRNQLRKLVPNLMEGYKMWRDSHPEIKNAYLLLHTNFSEGWNIKAQADQYGVDTKEILTTYICRSCRQYEVKSFDDRLEKFKKDNDNFVLDEFGQKIEEPLDAQNKNCNCCRTRGSQITTGVGFGISEEELNEVYNLMDVYVHPFTSGGQEIPIQEAKLTELITLVTNYSCGEECCEPEAYSLPLDWAKYLEHGTEFIKASTYPASIKQQLDKFISLSKEEKKDWGKKAREWTVKKFGISNVSREIEDYLDNTPFINDEDESSFESKEVRKQNPEAIIPSNLMDKEWIKVLYKSILDMEIEESNEGFQYWCTELGKNTERATIENYFRKVASEEIQKKEKIDFKDILDKNDEGRRLLFVMPQSAGDVFWCTSLLPSIKETYPDYNIYFATKKQYADILDGNEFIHKVIDYYPIMDNLLWSEGQGGNKGYFEITFLPHIGTQRILNYIHNGKDKLAFDIKNF